MQNITARHRRFVEEYTGEHIGKGAASARAAGYSDRRANRTAYELLQDPDIQAMISERLNELAMSAAEALKRMTDIARGSISEYMEVENGRLVVDVEAVAEQGHLVKRLKTNDEGDVTGIELYSAQDALKTIMDAHGAFNHTQQLEHHAVDSIEVEIIGTEPDIPPAPDTTTEADREAEQEAGR